MKEQATTENELNSSLGKATSDLESFKKSLNFRLNLAKSKETMLLKDHFKRFDAANIEMPEEVRHLKELLELRDREIEDLRQQVESNPILAERHARVLQLENQLKLAKGGAERDNQTIDAVLRLSEQVLRSLEDYKINISFLEAELSDIDFRQ